MHSVLKWIYSGLAAIARRLRALFDFLWGLMTQWVTWLITAIVAFWTWVWDYIGSVIGSALSELSSALSDALELPTFPGGSLSGLPAALLNLIQFQDAIDCLVFVFAFFVVARTARLAMIPLRAVLEIA